MKTAIINLKIIGWNGKARDKQWRIACHDEQTTEYIEREIHRCAPMGMTVEIVSIEWSKPTSQQSKEI